MSKHNETFVTHCNEKGHALLRWKSSIEDSTIMIIQSKDYRPGYVFGGRIILRRIEGSTSRDALQWETISEAELEAIGPSEAERKRAVETVFDDEHNANKGGE